MFIYAPEEKSEDEIALAKRDARRMIAVLEQHMQGRDFVVGERVTVADFNAAFTLDWANEEGLLDDAPALRAYLKAMYARPQAPDRKSAERGKRGSVRVESGGRRLSKKKKLT